MRSLTFGILLIKDVGILRDLCIGLINGSNMNEMDLGYLFFSQNGSGATATATATSFLKNCPSYSALRSKNFREQVADPCAGDVFLFDAACYGQYLGGIDPRNGPSTPGFVNQDSFFSVNDPALSYMWRKDEDGRRYPVIITGDKELRIANLHIHSKNLDPFLSKLDGHQGERFQLECDAWFGTEDDFAYNPNMRPYCNGKRTSKKPAKVFVYAHRLGQFDPGAYDSSFVLITGNSDENIDERYRTLFDHPNIKEAYCQNLIIDHPKCHILPIGQANRQWPHGSLNALRRVIKARLPHTRHIYNNFNIGTNYAARYKCAQIMAANGIPINSNKPYLAYLIDLASHKYSISPPGNGIDTHRFWECIYLGVIPVVISNPLTERLKREGYNMIVLDKWEDIHRLIHE